LLGWGANYLRRHWQISFRELLRPFLAPGVGIVAMVAATQALRLLPWGERPVVRIAGVVAATGLAYAGLLLQARRVAQSGGHRL
jgi:hypothetical protein